MAVAVAVAVADADINEGTEVKKDVDVDVDVVMGVDADADAPTDMLAAAAAAEVVVVVVVVRLPRFRCRRDFFEFSQSNPSTRGGRSSSSSPSIRVEVAAVAEALTGAEGDAMVVAMIGTETASTAVQEVRHKIQTRPNVRHQANYVT